MLAELRKIYDVVDGVGLRNVLSEYKGCLWNVIRLEMKQMNTGQC